MCESTFINTLRINIATTHININYSHNTHSWSIFDKRKSNLANWCRWKRKWNKGKLFPNEIVNLRRENFSSRNKSTKFLKETTKKGETVSSLHIIYIYRNTLWYRAVYLLFNQILSTHTFSLSLPRILGATEAAVCGHFFSQSRRVGDTQIDWENS